MVGGSAPTSPVQRTSPLSPGNEERRVSVSGRSPVILPSPLSGGMFSRGNGNAAGGGSNGRGLGFGIPPVGCDEEEEIDEDVPLPTFEVRPAMLAVDLTLLPGESRSCGCFFPPLVIVVCLWFIDTYSILLPENLPPTFKGRSLRFSYELIVGTCRATSGGTGSTSANSVSRVMKVPIRMYNHVSGTFRSGCRLSNV